MINFEQTIISQYGNSPTILGLIEGMNENIDPRADIDSFYSFVWNVNTAQGFGLDIWGEIVNVSRYILVPPDMRNFGFNEAGTSGQPFDQAPFYNGPYASETQALSDDTYRKLILVKALANVSATNARSLNQLLQNMFKDRGRCYVNDTGGMSFRYVFEFDLTTSEFAIMTQSGALPRPAGVQATFIVMPRRTFGFSEAGGAPFDSGPFLPEGSTYAII
jgi:hypothetical protein